MGIVEIALLQTQTDDHEQRVLQDAGRWGRPALIEAELWEASANRKEDGAWSDCGEVEEQYEVARSMGGVRKSVNAYGERV